MQKSKNLVFYYILTIIFCFCLLFSYYYKKFERIESVSTLSNVDVSIIQSQFKDGIISTDAVIDASNNGKVRIDFKLFSLFKIKSINRPIATEKIVYVGGDVFDFNLKLNGVIVLEFEDVKKDVGKANPLEKAGVKVGDRIIRINDKQVQSAQHFSEEIENSEGQIKLTVVQKGKEVEKLVTPVKDKTGKNKLGVWVKDDTLGTGTLSFVDAKTNSFIALGHNIVDYETGGQIECVGGDIKPCSVVGVKKSTRGTVGELRTLSNVQAQPQGEISGNSKHGIVGKITDKNYFETHQQMTVASALEVKIGKAQMLCTNENGQRQLYDIEIIKVEPQKEIKNLCIKVTDKNLLSKTGGIVQGMSGSPIIQNGKLAGILTHCFINNPHRGFALLATNVI